MMFSRTRGPSLRPRTLTTSFTSFASASISLPCHKNQSRAQVIGCERTAPETRRSLSESVKGSVRFQNLVDTTVGLSFTRLPHQRQLQHSLDPTCSRRRLYSSSAGTIPQTVLSTTQGEIEGPDDIVIIAECEAIDPDMLALKPDLGPTGLPPLPYITDDALRQQVFTHRSVYARARHDFEDSPHDPSQDNELLELQGDSVLGLVVTDLIRNCYSNLRVGPATKVRALVVANANLADISVKYGLAQSLRTRRSSAFFLKTSINIQADVFEAYVGGLYKDQGLDVVRNWLNALFLPYVKQAYRVCRDQHGLLSPPPSPTLQNPADATPLEYDGSNTNHNHDPFLDSTMLQNNIGHLSLFNQYIQQKHLLIEWLFDSIQDEGTKMTPIWEVRAIVDGHQISIGRGNTKKAAQNEAAREGLVQLGITNPRKPRIAYCASR